MPKFIPGSISMLITLTLVAPSVVPAVALAQNETVRVGVYGLKRLNIDLWTATLSQGRPEGVSVATSAAVFLAATRQAANEKELYSGLQAILAAVQIQSAADYYDLGVVLLKARQEVRQSQKMTPRGIQDSLFLLQMLAEESFFVGSRKFADFPKEASVQGTAAENSKTAPLRDFRVETGDIILSKATGSGSSSFIALTMDQPHVYSHSTPVYIDDQGRTISPEGFIEDGVKLRDLNTDYIAGSKTRMTIYRYAGKNSDVQKNVEIQSKGLIDEMYRRTGNDPFNKAAYKYDFTMSPSEDIENHGMFCSAVGYEIYRRAGYVKSENPYPRSVWSVLVKSREKLSKILNMGSDRVPAPGDLELNSQFAMVGTRVDISMLRQERVEMAIVDSFLASLEENPDLMERMTKSLLNIGNTPLNKAKIQAMAAAGMLPKQVADNLDKLDKVPDSINLKQMSFFAFLNQVLTPKVRESMTAQLDAQEKEGKFAGPIELRQVAREQTKAMLEGLSQYEDMIQKVLGN